MENDSFVCLHTKYEISITVPHVRFTFAAKSKREANDAYPSLYRDNLRSDIVIRMCTSLYDFTRFLPLKKYDKFPSSNIRSPSRNISPTSELFGRPVNQTSIFHGQNISGISSTPWHISDNTDQSFFVSPARTHKILDFVEH